MNNLIKNIFDSHPHREPHSYCEEKITIHLVGFYQRNVLQNFNIQF